MAQPKKHKQILDELQSFVKKQAAMAQTGISGKPGSDTNFTSISDEVETTNQNAVGPEELSDKQEHEQKPSTDSSAPIKSASIDEAADKILDLLSSKVAEAQKNISGKPGKDTNVTSISDETEHVDQNAAKPESLNDKQKHEQKPSTDSSAPIKSASTADIGKAFVAALQKRAAEVQIEQEKLARTEMLQKAARYDLDLFIANALQDLQSNEKIAEDMSKVAEAEEAEGAALFDSFYKQAQYEYTIEALATELQAAQEKIAQLNQLEQNTKVASQEAELEAKIARNVAAQVKELLSNGK